MKPIKNIPSKPYNPIMCDKIIKYLCLKADSKDSLDGILLGLFPNEFEKISHEILKNLEYLISIGKIQSVIDGKDRGFYKIVNGN